MIKCIIFILTEQRESAPFECATAALILGFKATGYESVYMLFT